MAEDRTPGIPAPGCVPAPTKYKLLNISDWLWNLKYADWENFGWIEKPEPWRVAKSISK